MFDYSAKSEEVYTYWNHGVDKMILKCKGFVKLLALSISLVVCFPGFGDEQDLNYLGVILNKELRLFPKNIGGVDVSDFLIDGMTGKLCLVDEGKVVVFLIDGNPEKKTYSVRGVKNLPKTDNVVDCFVSAEELHSIEGISFGERVNSVVSRFMGAGFVLSKKSDERTFYLYKTIAGQASCHYFNDPFEGEYSVYGEPKSLVSYVLKSDSESKVVAVEMYASRDIEPMSGTCPEKNDEKNIKGTSTNY